MRHQNSEAKQTSFRRVFESKILKVTHYMVSRPQGDSFKDKF